MTLGGILLFGMLFLLVVNSVFPADKLYLYSLQEPEKVAPVIEYQLPENESLIMKNRDDKEHLPDFLKSADNGHRVVEYYAPWCPHCRRFAPHYVSVARKVTAAASKMGQHVDFYAVSCVASNAICKSQGVHGYPSIRVYPAGSMNASSVMEGWEVHPFIVLSALGIAVDDVDLMGLEKGPEEPSTTIKTGGMEKMRSKHVRTKMELYSDAFLSFDFALRNGIFMASSTLTNSTKDALHQWLLLLRQALPPGWKIHQTIKALVNEFESVAKNETAFFEKLEPYQPEHQEWSPACSHEDGLPGYTCGLWELFHIMTVGVVEWNYLADNEWATIAPETAADILRNYVQHFFRCEVCRENFLGAYGTYLLCDVIQK